MSELNSNAIENAKKKLEEERNNAKDKNFAELVIEHLKKRCGEDPGFAADVLQEGKSWENCYEFIYKMARQMATHNRAVVRNDVVYEWAEDYYRMTPEQEKKAKIPKPSAASRKKPASASGQKTSAKPVKAEQGSPKSEQKEKNPPADAKKPGKSQKAKKSDELDGQLSLFDLM